MFLCLAYISIIVITLSFQYGNGEFQELSVASECFPKRLTDLNYPTCTFLVAKSAIGEFRSECIRTNNLLIPTLRIVGEFRILKIICTASYPIDFRYYGIQPTEAIFVDWYKEVHSNSKKSQKFTVEVKVYSVQELFEYYNNAENGYYDKTEDFLPLDTVHDYSRTGSYEFHKIFNKSLGTSFYLFLEDGAKPSILRNQKTVPKIVGNYFILPCVSSHFESVVELSKIPFSLTRQNFTQSHIDGFIFQSEDSGFERHYGSYQCVLKYKGEIVDAIDLEFHNSTITGTEKLFGLETFNFKERDDLDVLGEPILQGEYVKLVKPLCKTRNPSDPVDIAKLKMIFIPIHNFGYMRLVQQFALPKYFNRSYTARMVNSVTGGWDTLIREITQPTGTSLRMGTVYCTTGYSQKIADYGVSIRGIVKTFDYGEDWARFDRKSNDIKVHFGLDILNEFRPMYAGMIIAFVCRINIPVVVKPIVWYTERVDGTRKQEKVDYDLVGDTATWNANLSVDVTKVICSASYWYSDWWREISVSFTLQEITKPVIEKTETIKIFQDGARGVTLECLAWGNPKPNIYFERDGVRLYSLDSSNGTVIVFNKIDTSNIGKYTCVASNGYKTRKDFFIVLKYSHFDVLYVVIPFIVFLVTLVAAMVYIKFFRPEKTGLTQEEIDEFMKGTKKEQIPENDENYAHGFASMISYKTEYEVASERFFVDENRILGSGAFGIVYLGKVDNKFVAAKTIQKDAGKLYLKALLSELKIMIYLGHHPNLVQIVGAYTKELNKGIVYIFLEYVTLGSLESYLRKNKDQLLKKKIERSINVQMKMNGYTTWGCISETYDYKQTTVLTVENLLHWSKQIADGMEYLGFKKVIHGDLATRNVLLDENLDVKITDFGLSKKLYGYQEYIKKDQEPLPWRWMAIESLKFLNFSTASDVWAFGITLWEIFSLGEVPYAGYPWSIDFVKELQNGVRLKNPTYGSDQLFQIIRQCWHEDPKRRPSFKVLKQQLAQLTPLDIVDTSEEDEETVL